MTLTTANETEPVNQSTQHAMLVAWGRFARHLGVSQRVREAVQIARQANAIPGGGLILQFALASLAGYEYLQDLNKGTHPLVHDQAVADAWGVRFGHYTNVSRFLYQVDAATVEGVEAELAAMLQPFLRRAVHEALRQQGSLTLCGDLTGRPVSAYSRTCPPDTVFGYMANQLQKGHQAGWQRQLRSALDQEGQARRVLARHRQHLADLTAERDRLLNWLGQLEAENATKLGDCPYPLRLTLLRWAEGDGYHHSTLVSFSEQATLPTDTLFATYHQRQDVEAGFKEGKGTFSFSSIFYRAAVR